MRRSPAPAAGLLLFSAPARFRIRHTTPSVLVAEQADSTEARTMTLNVSLLDLVNAVSDHARSDAEAIATVVYMVNSGRVQLCGTFKGAHFDLATLGAGLAAVRPEPDRRAELMNHAVMD